jgi:RNA polymerase sigma-70 factor (ECF subfamily)
MIATRPFSPNRAATDGADDLARFVALLEAHRRILYKVAYVYCRDPEDRHDLMQEMALQLWRSFGRFEGRSRVSTFVYRVALNVAISHRRHEGRRLRDTAPLDFGLDVADADALFDTDDVGARRLRELIEGLDEPSRALVLLYLEGFDHAEIGAMLGLTASNVGTRLGRVKQTLKRRAGADGGPKP